MGRGDRENVGHDELAGQHPQPAPGRPRRGPGLALAQRPPALPGAPAPPAPVAGDGLPQYLLPDVPNFRTGTPVPGSGGSPTQRPVQVRGVDIPPHDAPANRLQELENYEFQAKKLFDQAIADLARANPDENAAEYQQRRAAATAAQSAYQAAQNAVTAETTREGQKKKPHTIEKREEGPPDRFGNTDTYLVTFKVDEQGNEVWDQSVAPKLLTKRTGSPTAGQELDLQTAQVGLQPACSSSWPPRTTRSRSAQLLAEVERARFALQQARATGPTAIWTTAQTNLRPIAASSAYEEATSPRPRRRPALAVEQARVAPRDVAPGPGPGQRAPDRAQRPHLPRHHDPRPQHRGHHAPSPTRPTRAPPSRRDRAVQRPGAPPAAGGPAGARPAAGAAAPGGHLGGGGGAPVPRSGSAPTWRRPWPATAAPRRRPSARSSGRPRPCSGPRTPGRRR